MIMLFSNANLRAWTCPYSLFGWHLASAEIAAEYVKSGRTVRRLPRDAAAGCSFC
jgi:hypothetical protein